MPTLYIIPSNGPSLTLYLKQQWLDKCQKNHLCTWKTQVGPYPVTLFTVTLPNSGNLFAARSRHCISYIDSAMDPQEIREYIHSFVNDGRIPSQTLFNLFQTTLRIFYTGEGLIKLNCWYVAPYEQGNLPRVFLDDEDTACLKLLGCHCFCLHVIVSSSHRIWGFNF